MLILHIAIALASVALTTHLYFVPTRIKLRVSYALVGLTIATGTWLVVAAQAAMLRTCMMGLLYVGIMTVVIVAARNKLVAQERNQSE